MSTIKTDNWVNVAGTKTYYGAQAWVNFNGTGVVAIRGSKNVSSITDNAAGKWTVNMTVAMADANYAVVGLGTAAQSGTTNASLGIDPGSPQTTSAFSLFSEQSNGTDLDAAYINAAVFAS